MIPKVIHQIWLGDPRKCPLDLINTWKEKNPTWKHTLWTDKNIPKLRNQEQFDAMKELAGKADILRYEILYNLGGFYIDADSKCIKPLDDSLLDAEVFCCYESEKYRPNLVANGYLATSKGSTLMEFAIRCIGTLSTTFFLELKELTAWMYTGPLFFSELLKGKHQGKEFPAEGMETVTIHPSHYFIPRHYNDPRDFVYKGEGPVYCDQYFMSTPNSIYDYHNNS